MIDPKSLNIAALPALPLTDRQSFPPVSCIYFAIDSQGEIQYIGRTVNMQQRWITHHRYPVLAGMEQIRIAYMPVEPDLLPSVEAALIDWFDPPLNGARTERICKQLIPGVRYMFSRLPNLMVERNPKMTQRSLASELKISHTTINKLYNGQPLKARIDPETVEIICNYFGCEVGDLLVLKEMPPSG
jgi:DNA-binding Xre family transcriptional regulator